MYLTDFSFNRYAEIVNVKLGNGQTRKGQVLEIAGRKAVVQVSSIVIYAPPPFAIWELLELAVCSSNYYKREAC